MGQATSFDIIYVNIVIVGCGDYAAPRDEEACNYRGSRCFDVETPWIRNRSPLFKRIRCRVINGLLWLSRSLGIVYGTNEIQGELCNNGHSRSFSLVSMFLSEVVEPSLQGIVVEGTKIARKPLSSGAAQCASTRR
jgi:hypothetical protein